MIELPPYFWEFHIVLVVSILLFTFYQMRRGVKSASPRS